MEMIEINSSTAREVAKSLLSIEAIKLNLENPFQWASGWNSPIYCDNRLSLSYPDIRTSIADHLAALIKEKFPQAEAIAGVATAGIPQGALIADRLGLPFIYVRSKAKSHGMTNMIEGKATEGQKVVVIEDLVSTGGSSIKACHALREADTTVLGMCAIFTYGFPIATENFIEADVSLHCLSDYPTLIEEALSTGYVKEDDLASLKQWREDPASWRK